jgi:radical SAM superfamily enzyme YgiQ (UPF0313 family)
MAKVLFLQDVWIEYYGLMQLSGLLKRHGHTAEILFASEESSLKSIKEKKPDLIAYSCMTIQWNWLKSMSSFLKKNGISTPQAVGGIHSTMYPDVTINHDGVDIICRGEGDYAILELCDALDKKSDYSSIKNLWVKQDGKIKKNGVRPKLSSTQLDALPFPDRDLYSKYSYFDDYPFVTFVGSRGCPFKCSFCEVPTIARLYESQKSTIYQNVDSFIDEIEDVKNKGLLKGKLVMFTDSTFNSHKKWFMEFCQKYKERINIPWSCNLRAELVDEDQAKLMKEANCDNVRFGVESGDEGIRLNILNKGKLPDESLYNCARLLKKYKIPFQTFNMFGFPTETYEQAWKTIKLNQKIKPDAVGMYLLLLFPYIGVTDLALKKGLIEQKDFEMAEKPPYNLQLSLLALHPERNKDIVKICNLQKLSILALRFPSLEPIIRKLCELPHNRFFCWFYLASQALEWRKWSTKATIKRMFYDGLLNYQALFGESQSKSGIFVKLSGLMVKKHRRDVKN